MCGCVCVSTPFTSLRPPPPLTAMHPSPSPSPLPHLLGGGGAPSTSSPSSLAFCSLEHHLPRCPSTTATATHCRTLSRRRSVPGNRDGFGSGTNPQFDLGSCWKLSVFAQAQPCNQPSRSHRSRREGAVGQGEALLVADTSKTGANSEITAVAVPPPFPPPQPQVGSPILWIGVGVGISVFFSWAARRIKNYALQQAFKSMMQQTGQGSSQFAGMPIMPPGSFPFPQQPPPPPPSASASPSPSPVVSSRTVDVTATAVASSATEIKETVEKKVDIKKPAFTDVNIDLSTEENTLASTVISQQSPEKPLEQASSGRPNFVEPEIVDGAAFGAKSNNGGPSSTTTDGKSKSFISMDMLERMLDDPKVQQMVFPYLPEEMRDPVTFKRMIQLPPVRQQLQEALNNMGGEDGLDMFKYMNSDMVKSQFEQIGLTPDEVVGKIMSNPDIAASLQNSKVVEAIMDCSQNPLNITKYQNDKEVMDALFKIAELFPGATSSPY